MIILFSTLFGVHPIAYAESAYYHTFSVDSINHNLYGFTYPITYEFSIPSGSSNLRAYKRFSMLEAWFKLLANRAMIILKGLKR